MATRSSWKGYLQLSLVCVPVKAYSTGSSGGGEIHLNQLHADCHSRIQYKKVCPLHGEVATNEIVSGYEYARDRYVVVDPDELDRLRTEADKAIKIDVFIASGAFDPLYTTGKKYYLAPNGPAGQKAYALLCQAMVAEDCYGIAQVVLHGREQLAHLRAFESQSSSGLLPTIRRGGRSSQDGGVCRGIADGPDPGQRFHGRLQPGEVSGPLHPQTAAVDWSESGGPGACDSPGHPRTAGDQPDGGAQAKRGPSPGNQRSQEGTAQIHPTAGPQDLLGGTG